MSNSRCRRRGRGGQAGGRVTTELREEGTRMAQLVEMDERVTLREQMAQEVGPVILINQLTVKPEAALAL